MVCAECCCIQNTGNDGHLIGTSQHGDELGNRALAAVFDDNICGRRLDEGFIQKEVATLTTDRRRHLERTTASQSQSQV